MGCGAGKDHFCQVGCVVFKDHFCQVGCVVFKVSGIDGTITANRWVVGLEKIILVKWVVWFLKLVELKGL